MALSPTSSHSSSSTVTLIQTLNGDGSSGVFDFQNIAGAYSRLEAVIVGRSDANAATDDVYVRFNNDTGANYYWQYLRGTNVTASASPSTADANGVYLGGVAAATATANFPGTIHALVPVYAGTTFYKQVLARDWVESGTAVTTYIALMTAGTWANTAAVTRLTARLASGKWITGSSAILYGIS